MFNNYNATNEAYVLRKCCYCDGEVYYCPCVAGWMVCWLTGGLT